MHYLITGHTGFKGSWLAVWLAMEGHRVSGLGLDPLPGSLFSLAGVDTVMTDDLRIDIRNRQAIVASVEALQPDMVVHLAAQPLVRESYRDPRTTFETNVMGTLNVLEAVDLAGSAKAHLVVTTDKVYRNVGQSVGYREGDALGGRDPYSASKAMADLLTQSWATSFPSTTTAIARAGNVLGGGDRSHERLVPDVVQALERGQTPVIRNPHAVRPWQHVLDCLHGYRLLIDRMAAHPDTLSQFAWNFGPDASQMATVADVVGRLEASWGHSLTWDRTAEKSMHEESLLTLNADEAREHLNWVDVLDLEETIDWTVGWYKRCAAGEDALSVTEAQLETYAERLESLTLV